MGERAPRFAQFSINIFLIPSKPNAAAQNKVKAIYVQVALLPLVAAHVCLPGLDSR